MSCTINFEDLNTLKFKVNGSTNFNEVTQLMDNRFTGLPFFHKSIDLKVKNFNKIVQNQTGTIIIPKEVEAVIAPHLQNDLRHLIAYIQREPGTKSFGLIHLSVKFPFRLLNKEFNNLGRGLPRIFKNLFIYMGSRVKVPVVLAVASRKTNNHYESLAVGLSGISRYCSALYVHPLKEGGYIVKGGLEVEVFSQHISHNLGRLIHKTKDYLLPYDFFNMYLKKNLTPEREKIVEKLCKYVFGGCQLAEKLSNTINVQKLKE